MPTKKEKVENKEFNYEKGITEIENIVTKLEKGELNLDESLLVFSKGINLVKQCNNYLESAELTIKELLGDDLDECADYFNLETKDLE